MHTVEAHQYDVQCEMRQASLTSSLRLHCFLRARTAVMMSTSNRVCSVRGIDTQHCRDELMGRKRQEPETKKEESNVKMLAIVHLLYNTASVFLQILVSSFATLRCFAASSSGLGDAFVVVV
jgi:hypothetical protein